jgi:hypothetical protein
VLLYRHAVDAHFQLSWPIDSTVIDGLADIDGRRENQPAARRPLVRNNPTIADAILDRLVHNAYRIELKGDSLRKQKQPAQDQPVS